MTNPFAARAQRPAPAEPMITPAQSSYLRDLLMTKAQIKGMDMGAVSQTLDGWLPTVTKAMASKFIDQAKVDNKRLMGMYDALKITATPVVEVEIEEGMYVTPLGTIWKVYRGRETHRLITKELVISDRYEENDDGSQGPRILGERVGEFVYRGQAPIPAIARSGRRLTIDEAREFGSLYGQCCMCLRVLTDELSVHLGIGPVCGGREFGETFKFMLKEAKALADASA